MYIIFQMRLGLFDLHILDGYTMAKLVKAQVTYANRLEISFNRTELSRISCISSPEIEQLIPSAHYSAEDCVYL